MSLEKPSGPMPGIPRELPQQASEETRRLRSLTLEQRGEMLIAACELASEIEAARLRAGLPPSQPAPWPESTWEFLRKATADAKRRSQSNDGE